MKNFGPPNLNSIQNEGIVLFLIRFTFFQILSESLYTFNFKMLKYVKVNIKQTVTPLLYGVSVGKS